ncbi:hypothetical protein DJ68_12940 [Halorubrum sp. C3]|nr:hypothetical protein DJ68_12940 [Halorubrum sp. C3]
MNGTPLIADRRWRVVAFSGFFALFIGIFAAYRTPAAGYELSIYAETPLLTWAGLVIAIGSATWLSIGATRWFAQVTGFGLATLVVFSFTALPVIRGYSLFARSDTFGHVGWTRDLLSGNPLAETLLYPAPHVVSTEIILITDSTISQVIMLLVPIFVILYCLCVEITARSLLPSRHHLGTGVLVGAILTPIMTVQLPNLQMTPLTLAVFYLTFVVAVLTMCYQGRGNWRHIAVFFVSLPTLVVLHPLVALASVAFLAGVAAIRRFTPKVALVSSPPRFTTIAGSGSVVLGFLFYVQSVDVPAVGGAIGRVLIQIQGGIDPTGGVSDRTGGLSTIGVSLWEIVLKLFTAKIMLGTLAAVTILWALRTHLSRDGSQTTELILTYTLALLPVLGLSGVVAAAGRLNLTTRFLAIVLVVLSIVAAVGITQFRTDRRRSRRAVAGLCVLLVLTTLIAAPALFTSPYLYQGTPHVTETERVGYATLFEHRSSDVTIGSTRTLVDRHRTAYYGQDTARGNGFQQSNTEVLATIKSDRSEPYFFPYHFNETLPSRTVSNSTYLVIPESDRIVDLELYDGLRYTKSSYDSISRDRNIDKLYSSGGFTTYLVDPK